MQVDPATTVLGFVLGSLATYLADRATDKRRERETRREQDRLWRDIEQRFPAVIAEMRADFTGPEGLSVRAFFVKASNTVLGLPFGTRIRVSHGQASRRPRRREAS